MDHDHTISFSFTTGSDWLRIVVVAGAVLVIAAALLRPAVAVSGRTAGLVVTIGAACVALLQLLLADGLDMPQQAVVALLAAAAVPIAGARHLPARPTPARPTPARPTPVGSTPATAAQATAMPAAATGCFADSAGASQGPWGLRGAQAFWEAAPGDSLDRSAGGLAGVPGAALLDRGPAGVPDTAPVSGPARRVALGVVLAAAAWAGVELARAWLWADGPAAATELVDTAVLIGIVGLSWLVLCHPRSRTAAVTTNAAAWVLGNLVLAGVAVVAAAGIPAS